MHSAAEAHLDRVGVRVGFRVRVRVGVRRATFRGQGAQLGGGAPVVRKVMITRW